MNTPKSLAGRVLGVFAKKPVAGQVKTRVAAALSSAAAERLALAFLEDSLDRFALVTAERRIVYAPAAARSFFRRLANGRYGCVAQGEGDLGERLHSFFETSRDEGFQRIVVVGADSPTMPIEYIEHAFELLRAHDVVLGPACDGGYYLVGAGARMAPIFAGIPWSTPRVLEATVRRLDEAAARTALLPPWYDVDTADDWAMLCGHVRAMRLAGIDPGVPRVEQLMREQI